MEDTFDIRNNRELQETEREFENALRPLSFSSFSGQDKVVENLKIFVSAARMRGESLDHVLLHGPPGLGKTIKQKVAYADGKYTVTLSSKYLAKDVFVEIPIQGAKFTDNFFDLLPGEKKTIVITSPQLKASEKTPITVKHMRETY